MEHCLTLIKNDFQIPAGRKVIKGSEYGVCIEVEKLIAEARQAAERIQAEAHHQYQASVDKRRQVEAEMDSAYQDAVRQGYQAGYRDAQTDYAAEINGALIDRAALMDRLEPSLVDTLMAALETILGAMGADRILREVAAQALRKAGRAQFVKLRVHPDRVATVQDVIRNVKEEFDGLEWIEVAADADLQPEGCLLQTSAGILDFSLDTQLRVLKKCLRERVRMAGAL